MDDTRRSRHAVRKLRPRYLAAAGALFFLAGLVAFMGIITAEALYPKGYSTSQNEISDLGATEPPHSVSEQPSATVFNAAMMACGVLMLAASSCLQRASGRLAAPILTALVGIGVLGVGAFPGDYGNLHAAFALLTFAAGGVAAIVAVTVETSSFRCFSVILGVVALAGLILHLALGDSSPLAPLGVGGVERWIAYPILFFVTGLGGHLMGRAR